MKKIVYLGFYFCMRLSMICAFSVYYAYTLECCPISEANYGYSLNSAIYSVSGVVIPFIIKFLNEKYVFIIYGIFGVVCIGLLFFLKETRGKPRAITLKK